MKQIILFLVVILLSIQTFAQNTEAAVQAQLNSIFINIDKSQIPNGYLSEYGGDFVEKRLYNGVLADSNFIVNKSGYNFLYNDIATARIYVNAPTMVSIDSVDALIGAVPASTATPLLFLTAQYGTLNENAVNNGYFRVQNNQLFDAVPSTNARVNFKYIFNQAFAAVPTEAISKIKGAISLSFNPTLVFTNSNQNITQVWVDFLDGQGYNEILSNSQITKNYTDSSGDKKFNIKVQCSNGNVFYSASQQYVQINETGSSSASRYAGFDQNGLNNPAYTIQTGTDQYSKVYIRYSSKRPTGPLHNKIVKPFIIVEGYDIHDVAPDLAKENYDVNKLIDEWDKLFEKQFYDFNGNLDDQAGYDLIFVDYYTMDAIPNNARMLENVINWVNANKENNSFGVREKNVVMGISMGGLVSRYCLAQMTKENKITDTRLLLTMDSPHQGANVPVSLQHFLYDFGNMSVGGGFKIGKNTKKLQQFYSLNQQPATQAQLLVRVTDVSNNYSFNTFLLPGGQYRQMVDFTPVQLTNTPPSYVFEAVSQGSQCGINVIPTNTKFVDYEDDIAKLRLYFGIALSAKYKLTAKLNALPDYGSSNTVCYSKMQRNIRGFFGFIGLGWSTTYEYTRPSPANIFPWDCVPGSTQSLSGRNGSFGDTSVNLNPAFSPHRTFLGNMFNFDLAVFLYPIVHVNTNFTVAYQQDLFTFVPITSSLDVANVDINSFNRTRLFPVDGLAGSRSVKYIAQQKFINPLGGQPVSFYNLNHTDFSKRNSTWIFNEMENANQIITCEDYCINDVKITPEEGICANSNTYEIANLPPGATVAWSVTPTGIVTPNSSSANPVTLTKINEGTITLTANVTLPCSNIPGNTTSNLSFSKVLAVANVGLTGTYFTSQNANPMSFTGNTSINMQAQRGQYVSIYFNIASTQNLNNLRWSTTTNNIIGYGNSFSFNTYASIYQYGSNNTTIYLDADSPCGSVRYLFGFNIISSLRMIVTASPNPVTSNEINLSVTKEKDESVGNKNVQLIPKITNPYTKITITPVNSTVPLKVLVFKENTSTNYKINTAGLTAGIYAITVERDELITTTKIIVL